MPRQQVRAASARIASQRKTRLRDGPIATTSSSSARSPRPATMSGSSAPRTSRSSPPVAEGRQLRSRTVPISTDAGNTGFTRAGARPIRARRRSQSAASSRASEAETCHNSNAVAMGRPTPRLSIKRRAVPVQTRATTSANGLARMTFGSGVGPRRRLVSQQGQEHQLPQGSSGSSSQNLPATRTARNLRNTLVARTTQHQLSKRNIDVSCQVTGCHVRLQPLPMVKHLFECRSRFPCPLAPNENCKWVGSSSQTKNHIIKDHHRTVVCRTGPNGLISLKNWRRAAPLQWLTIQTCLGQDFLVIFKKCDIDNRYSLFGGLVSIFGEQEDNEYEFRMALKSHGTANRVFSYSSVVEALQNAYFSIKKEDCFSFDSAYAELFSKDDDLEVEFSISVT